MQAFLPGLKALLLPAIALALPQASILTRIMRSAMLEVMHEDYMRTARAKGLTFSQTLARHGLRNALIPVITILGLQFSFLLAGTVIIENVFSLPGLGRLVFQAINQRDLITVKAVIMLLVATVICVNFLVDLTYGVIDPRLHARRSTVNKPRLFSSTSDREHGFLCPRHQVPLLCGIGFLITLFFVSIALVSFVWTPHDALSVNIAERLKPMSSTLLAWNGPLWPRSHFDDHAGCAQFHRRCFARGGYRHGPGHSDRRPGRQQKAAGLMKP